MEIFETLERLRNLDKEVEKLSQDIYDLKENVIKEAGFEKIENSKIEIGAKYRTSFNNYVYMGCLNCDTRCGVKPRNYLVVINGDCAGIIIDPSNIELKKIS